MGLRNLSKTAEKSCSSPRAAGVPLLWSGTLSVSHHPTLHNDERRVGLEYLGIYGYVPTPPHDFIWLSQMEAEEENGRWTERPERI